MNELKSFSRFRYANAIQVIYISAWHKVDLPICQEEILNTQHFNGAQLLIENIAGKKESITYRQDGGKSTGAEADMLDKLFQSGQK